MWIVFNICRWDHNMLIVFNVLMGAHVDIVFKVLIEHTMWIVFNALMGAHCVDSV